jgi:hypothetical protein
VPKSALRRSNTEPEEPSDENPFLISGTDLDDEFFTSVSHSPSPEPPSSSVRSMVITVFEETNKLSSPLV